MPESPELQLTLARTLEWMKDHGSSVTLTWGEDTWFWECNWITGGEHYSGFSSEPLRACRMAIDKARSSMEAKV